MRRSWVGPPPGPFAKGCGGSILAWPALRMTELGVWLWLRRAVYVGVALPLRV